MKKTLVVLAMLTSSVAFAAKGGFDAKGTVKSVDSDDLVIQREGQPDIELDVRRETTIQRDGQQAQLDQLQPGDEVRAKFQVYGDDVVALELEAKAKK